MARLASGSTVESVRSELNLLDKQISRELSAAQLHGGRDNAFDVLVQPLKNVVTDKARPRVVLLCVAVGGVLLITCINLAAGQVARWAELSRDAALRMTFGASPIAVALELMSGLLIVTLLGALLAALLAVWGVSQISRSEALSLPRLSAIHIDTSLLLILLAVTILSTVALGLFPTVEAFRSRSLVALLGTSRTESGRSSPLFSQILVGLQVCACTALLLTTSYVIRSLVLLSTAERGFNATAVMLAKVTLEGASVNDGDRRTLYDRLLAKLPTMSHVKQVTLVSGTPLQGEGWIDSVVPSDAALQRPTLANFRWIGPSYFSVLSIPILSGRELGLQDRGKDNVVISAATARDGWGSEDPIGRVFRWNDHPYTIVGVAADARLTSLRKPAPNFVYMPFWQNPPYEAVFLIRAERDKALVTPDALKQVISSFSPGAVVSGVRPLSDVAKDSLTAERLEAATLTIFSGGGLLIAIMGVYTSTQRAVERRTREFAIRLALGGTFSDLRQLLFSSLSPAIFIGLIAGWAGSLFSGHLIKNVLYEFTSPGFSPFAVVSVVVIIACSLAVWFPLRRIYGIEPLKLLRDV